jgi:Uma2 family endonuclease
MLSMRAAKPRVSYANLERAPDDGHRYELYGGEVFVVPSPLPEHQMVVQAILKRLESYAEAHGGITLIAPLDIVLSEFDVVQPDIVFFRTSRRHLVQPRAVTRAAPDIAVEVMSPSTAGIDRGRKMQLFARYGVPECWLVDPAGAVVEVYALHEGVYRLALVASGDDLVRSTLLPDFSFRASEIFPSL